mmetsp:Transcript_5313/g.19910  ORF Transcript_5313/g.19910 Transcript_5313/m.19910 type:complete len:281 (+) Transcript_5313:1257-2099(+)
MSSSWLRTRSGFVGRKACFTGKACTIGEWASTWFAGRKRRGEVSRLRVRTKTRTSAPIRKRTTAISATRRRIRIRKRTCIVSFTRVSKTQSPRGCRARRRRCGRRRAGIQHGTFTWTGALGSCRTTKTRAGSSWRCFADARRLRRRRRLPRKARTTKNTGNAVWRKRKKRSGSTPRRRREPRRTGPTRCGLCLQAKLWRSRRRWGLVTLFKTGCGSAGKAWSRFRPPRRGTCRRSAASPSPPRESRRFAQGCLLVRSKQPTRLRSRTTSRLAGLLFWRAR